MKRLLCAVALAIALEMTNKLVKMNPTVPWSPVSVFGAVTFIVAVANLVYQPCFHTTLVQLLFSVVYVHRIQ